ncbi:NIM1-interacting protein [Melia azedarach]|uniref:NIM1-interacting protein n=1 Tax=Melia azedarach TaxID=155640 RepID=A0ACC1YXU8_MELAZ|nr:NIM1-interacting protein [Melia azedarach]
MENIATAGKKRKLCRDEEEEDNDEEKMEKFYTLVRNIREVRERLMSRSYSTKEIENNDNNRLSKISKLEEKKPVEVWKPAFQREDFLEDIDQFKNPHDHSASPVAAAASQISKPGAEKEETKGGLDLTLSL